MAKREETHQRHGRDHEDEDLEGGGAEEVDEEPGNIVYCLCPGIFGTIIADEAQKLKSPITISHKAVVDLHVTYHLFLTATPTINRALDLLLYQHRR